MISRVLEQEDVSPMIFKGCPQLSSRFTDMLSGEKVTLSTVRTALHCFITP